MSHTNRVIVLVDMDCFYCQVEEHLNPSLKGKPMAVVQYNAWRGGGIIAVNYEARARGVTRHMRGDEAKKNCPEMELVRVPNVRGKADLTKYREAGKSVAKVLQTFTPLLERASVDEAYLDITEAVQKRLDGAYNEITLNLLKNTHVVGSDKMDYLYNLYNSGLHVESNLKLAFGGVIAEEIRAEVYAQTGYTCSAGIAHNKVLAKLACGLNKPNKQTLLPQDSIEELYKNLPVKKIRSLGGKFGHALSEDLGITNMAELVQFSKEKLTKRYDEKTASWLYNIARGIDHEPVTTRLVSKSIGCCKKFPGKSALVKPDSVMHWLNELAQEIAERLEADLEENNRRAKQMVVSFTHEVQGRDVALSRTHALNVYDAKKIADDAFGVIKKNCSRSSGTFCLKFLGISAGKFEDCRNVNAITSFFGKIDDTNTKPLDTQSEEVTNRANYSDTTEELDENSRELTFFEESTVSDTDSISNELSNDVEPKESFFLRYFQNKEREKRESPVLRDFNTSRILEELPDETQTGSICGECGQSICESEMLSHMDYHFALKMVKEESHLYVSAPMSSKRKSPDGLEAFLKGKSDSSSNDMEVCPQCSKRISCENYSSHLDYHAAKKLHMEINPVKSVNKSGVKKQHKDSGIRSVAAFFKPR